MPSFWNPSRIGYGMGPRTRTVRLPLTPIQEYDRRWRGVRRTNRRLNEQQLAEANSLASAPNTMAQGILQQQVADINERFQQQQADLTGNLVARGLAGSTLARLRGGIEGQRARAVGAAGADMARAVMPYVTQGQLAKINVLEGSREEGPDPALFAQLMQGAARGAGQRSGPIGPLAGMYGQALNYGGMGMSGLQPQYMVPNPGAAWANLARTPYQWQRPASSIMTQINRRAAEMQQRPFDAANIAARQAQRVTDLQARNAPWDVSPAFRIGADYAKLNSIPYWQQLAMAGAGVGQASGAAAGGLGMLPPYVHGGAMGMPENIVPGRYGYWRANSPGGYEGGQNLRSSMAPVVQQQQAANPSTPPTTGNIPIVVNPAALATPMMQYLMEQMKRYGAGGPYAATQEIPKRRKKVGRPTHTSPPRPESPLLKLLGINPYMRMQYRP